jgi:5-dehydro-2-deoxygluconokinase
VIDDADPLCRGIAMLGLDADAAKLDAALAVAAETARVKGFAIGRAIFGAAAKAWLDREITDREAVSHMEERFAHFVEVWRGCKG